MSRLPVWIRAKIIEIRELIKELGKEHTIILSTHILPEASNDLRNVLIVINEGRISGDVKLAEGKAISIDAGVNVESALIEGKTLYLEVNGTGGGGHDRSRIRAECESSRRPGDERKQPAHLLCELRCGDRCSPRNCSNHCPQRVEFT